MIAALMLYLTVIGSLFVVAAHAAESLLRLTRKPGRLAWVAAILLMCLVPLANPQRSSEPLVPSGPVFSASDVLDNSQAPVTSAATEVRERIQRKLTPSTDGVLARLDRPLLVLWVAGSIAWAVLLVGSAVRVTLKARAWRPLVLDGIPVLVSHDTGPALIGAISPQIVLPSWALDLSSEKRILLLTDRKSVV